MALLPFAGPVAPWAAVGRRRRTIHGFPLSAREHLLKGLFLLVLWKGAAHRLGIVALVNALAGRDVGKGFARGEQVCHQGVAITPLPLPLPLPLRQAMSFQRSTQPPSPSSERACFSSASSYSSADS